MVQRQGTYLSFIGIEPVGDQTIYTVCQKSRFLQLASSGYHENELSCHSSLRKLASFLL